jgi:hypothetical protein
MSDNQQILVIPRVFANITEERIRRTFDQLNIGEVTQVDIEPKTDNKGTKFNRVFVHINWNDSSAAVKARERLLQGKAIKIVYDDPWFWIVSANGLPAPKPAGGRRRKRKSIKKRKTSRRRNSIRRRH